MKDSALVFVIYTLETQENVLRHSDVSSASISKAMDLLGWGCLSDGT